MSPVGAINSSNPQVAAATSLASTNVSLNGLTKNTFLQMLAAQIRYQDPMAPIDNSTLVSQMAQLATMEVLQNLSEQVSRFEQYEKVMLSATLIGKQVSVRDHDGRSIEGAVEGISFEKGQVWVKLGDSSYPVESVETVWSHGGETK
ncbi:MAG: hypothetical protein H5U02_04490 [Clostridia bacterium]|nr:hypothetical protein [Clostridia bacterium]